MKKTTTIIAVVLLLNILILALTIGDFLALHDIQNDYVSAEVLSTFEITTSAPLPEWTQAPGEWLMVTTSFVARLITIPLTILLLWWLRKKEG
ncbi:MAG: hypothetical protein HN855_04600 [Anaerolineae bacterium]|jgi:hypothetical protein|nr:hypothetical protein [Anaerolineae bacterium]MBT7070375.1 hypothetical protein [Anaerolineae bacterium]MBT7324417.1 hypothetical protein [Anaerolineae bacterium]